MSTWRTPKPRRRAANGGLSANGKSGKHGASKPVLPPAQRVAAFVTKKRQTIKALSAQVPVWTAERDKLIKTVRTLTLRWQLRRKKKLLRRVQVLDQRIAEVEAGTELLEFNRAADKVTTALQTAKSFHSLNAPDDKGATDVPSGPSKRRSPWEAADANDNKRTRTGKKTAAVSGKRRRTPQVNCREVTASHINAAASEHTAALQQQALFDEALEVEFLGQFDGDRTGNLYRVPDERCDHCNHVLEHDQATNAQVCTSCHREKKIMDAATGFGHAIAKSDRYRRQTYFRANMARLQGLYTNSKLSKAAVNRVGRYLAENNVPEDCINSTTVEIALVDLELGCLIPCKNAIVALLTGTVPQRLTRDQFAQADQMFAMLSAAFERLKQRDDIECINMVNYNLCTFKILELVKWGAPFLKYFRASDKKDRLTTQDKIWRLFCDECGFTYIKTA